MATKGLPQHWWVIFNVQLKIPLKIPRFKMDKPAPLMTLAPITCIRSCEISTFILMIQIVRQPVISISNSCLRQFCLFRSCQAKSSTLP